MQQASVTDYFKKVKKRPREDGGSKLKASKLLGVSDSEDRAPSPVPAVSDTSSPELTREKRTQAPVNLDRKTTKAKRTLTLPPVEKGTEVKVKPGPSSSSARPPDLALVSPVPADARKRDEAPPVLAPNLPTEEQPSEEGPLSRPPRLTPISPLKLSAAMLAERASAGMPRLRPISPLKGVAGSSLSPRRMPAQGSPLKVMGPKKVGESPKLTPISPAKFFSPSSRGRDVFSSPVKLSEIRSPAKTAVKRLFEADGPEGSKPAKVPAYQRYNHLVGKPSQEEAVAVPAATSSTKIEATPLPLPYKYNVLLELFRAVETVSSILHNRKELITFSKLKPAVQELMRQTALRETHLAQILQVYPGAYRMSRERVKSNSGQMSYQLALTINLAKPTETLSAAAITERRRIFTNGLLAICHEHHKKFLATLNPPLVIPVGKKVTRWHPKFQLDGLPDIPAAALPSEPETSKMSNSSAKDVLAKAQDILECANPRMKKALDDLMKRTAGTGAGAPAPAAEAPAPASLGATKDAIARAQQALLRKAKGNPKMTKALNDILAKNDKAGTGTEEMNRKNVEESAQPPAPVTGPKEKVHSKVLYGALKGVSQALLDKIRAREQEKSIRAMTLTPEESKRRTMLNRLPDLVKILRNIVVAEKKAALPLRLVVNRLCHSYRAGVLSELDGEEHIRLLGSLLPEWIKLLKFTQGEYLKMDKTLDINQLLEQLSGIIKRTN